MVTVAYRSGPALSRMLESLADDGYASEVIVVDNGGGGPEIDAARSLPGVRVVAPETNLGFGAGCNLGASEANGEILFFLNPDTVVAPGSVRALAVVAADPAVGVAMPRLRLLDRPDLLNSGGNVVHISGLAWAGRFEHDVDEVAGLEDIPYASGAALAIRASLFRELGGFTEELFMYQEDLELSWRARLRGLRVAITPAADVYHDYDFDRNPAKRYLLERNRLIFVLTTYSSRMLAVLAPVLIATELGLLVLALREGWARDKVAGWRWLVAHNRWVRTHRAETQGLRAVSDRALAEHLAPSVDPEMLPLPRGLNLFNHAVAGYWRLARKVL